MIEDHSTTRVEQQASVLPPGIDQLSTTSFGYFIFSIGKINWFNIKYPMSETKLRIQFWGDNGPGRLVVSQNSIQHLKSMYPSEVEYDIRCSIWHFHKYISDMQDIVLQVMDRIGNILAYVPINLFYLIKDSVTENDISPLHRELKSGIFPIMQGGPQNKVGEIEISIKCEFDKDLNKIFKSIAEDTENVYTPQQIEEILNNHIQLSDYKNQKIGGLPQQNKYKQQIPSSLQNAPKDNTYNQNQYEENFQNLDQIQKEKESIQKQKQDLYDQQLQLKKNYKEQQQQQQQLSEIKENSNELQQQQSNQMPNQQEQQQQQQNYMQNVLQEQQNSQPPINGQFNDKLDQILQLGYVFMQQMKDNKTQQELQFEQQNIQLQQKEQELQLKEKELLLKEQEQKDKQKTKKSSSSTNKVKKSNPISQVSSNVPLLHGHYDTSEVDPNELRITQQLRMKEEEDLIKLKEQQAQYKIELEQQKIDIQKKILQEKQEQQNLQLQAQQDEQLKKNKQHEIQLELEKKATRDLQYKLIKDKNFLKIKIIDLNIIDQEHEEFQGKYQDKQLFIDTQIPALLKVNQDSNQIIYKRKQVGKTLLFNQDISNFITINENNFDTVIKQNLQFTLGTVSTQNTSSVVTDIAQGTLGFGRILTKAPEFEASYNVRLIAKNPMQNQQFAFNQNQQKMLIPESNLQQIKNDEAYLGNLRINFKLSTKKELLQHQPENLNEDGQSIKDEEQQQQYRSKSPQKPQTNQIIKEKAQNNQKKTIAKDERIFQLFLQLKQLKIIEKKLKQKNFFARYKIYGSPEEIETEIFWNSSSEIDLDHQMMIPITKTQIQRMAKLPLLIQIWNKEIGKDVILGIVKLNLTVVPQSVFKGNTIQYNKVWDDPKNQSQILVLYNENVSCKDIKTNTEKATLYVNLCFGSAKQINHFVKQSEAQKAQYQKQLMQQQYNNNDNNNQQNQQQLNIDQLLLDQSKMVSPQNLHKNQLQSPQQNIQQNNQNQSKPLRDYQTTQQKQQQFQDPYSFGGYDIGQSTVTLKSTDVIIDIMEQIRKKHNKLSEPLARFLGRDVFVSDKNFYDFMIQLDVSVKGKYLVNLIRLLDYQNDKSFKTEYFGKSYTQFVKYENPIRQHYENIIRDIIDILKDNNRTINAFERELNKFGELGYVKRDILSQKLREVKLAGFTAYLSEQICEMLDINQDGFLFVSYFTDYLRSYTANQQLKSIILSPSWFEYEITKKFEGFIKEKSINTLKLKFYKEKMDQDITIDQVMSIIQDLGLEEFSFWEAFVLIEYIKKQENNQELQLKMPQCLIPFELLEKHIGKISHTEIIQIDNKNKSNVSDLKNNLSSQLNIIDNNSSSNFPQQINELYQQTTPPKGSIHKQQQSILEQPEEEKIQTIQHTLKINVIEIQNLQLPDKYEYLDFFITYNFPNSEEEVQTVVNEYQLDKTNNKSFLSQTYQLNSEAYHSYYLPIDDPLDIILPFSDTDENIPDEKKMHFTLFIKKGKQTIPLATGILKNQQILSIQQGRNDLETQFVNKIDVKVPLQSKLQVNDENPQKDDNDFQYQNTIVLGHLSCQLSYEAKPIKDQLNTQQQEMQISKNIPKKGYICADIKCIPSEKLLEQLQNQNSNSQSILPTQLILPKKELDDGYFFTLEANIFHENQYLQSIFKPFTSPPLYNNITTNVLELQDSLHINLNQELVQHFQKSTLKLNLKLYSVKSRNIYILGENTENIPLLPLLLEQKIEGETNLSVPNTDQEFSGILQYSLKYLQNKPQKIIEFENQNNTNSQNQLIQSQKNKLSFLEVLQKKFTNYSVIIYFNELISYLNYENIFDANGLIFFEFTSLSGKKFQSNKSYSVDLLQHKCIEMDNNFIEINVESLDELSLPLEICVKLINNKSQNENNENNENHLGFISIDLKKLFAMKKPGQQRYFQSHQYLTIFKDQQIKMHQTQDPIKLRVLANINVFAFESQEIFSETLRFIEQKILHPEIENQPIFSNNDKISLEQNLLEYFFNEEEEQEKTQKNKEFIQQFLEITQISNEFFQKTVKSHRNLPENLHFPQKNIQNQINQLLQAFSNEDELNSGFIPAQICRNLIINHNLQDYIPNFQVSPYNICTNTDKIQVNKQVDYLQLLKYISNEQIIKNDQEYQIYTADLLQNPQKYINFMEKLKKYRLQIYVKSAQNLQSLSQETPNSYVCFPQLNFQTEIQPRQFNPDFYEYFQTKNLQQKIEFVIFERKYKLNTKIQDYPLGKGVIDIHKMMDFDQQLEGKKMEFKVLIQKFDGNYLQESQPNLVLEIGVYKINQNPQISNQTQSNKNVNYQTLQNTIIDINQNLDNVNIQNNEQENQQPYKQQNMKKVFDDISNTQKQLDQMKLHSFRNPLQQNNLQQINSQFSDLKDSNQYSGEFKSSFQQNQVNPFENNLIKATQSSEDKQNQEEQKQQIIEKNNIENQEFQPAFSFKKNNSGNNSQENEEINNDVQPNVSSSFSNQNPSSKNNSFKQNQNLKKFKVTDSEINRIQEVMQQDINVNSKFDQFSSDSD